MRVVRGLPPEADPIGIEWRESDDCVRFHFEGVQGCVEPIIHSIACNDVEAELTAALLKAMLQATPPQRPASADRYIEASGLSYYHNAIKVLVDRGVVDLNPDCDPESRLDINGQINERGRKLMEEW